MKNKCIEFKNSINENLQELYFYGDIVSEEWQKWNDADTCPQDIIDILGQINDTKPLDIYLNSCGGNVFAGMAIYNMLKRNKTYKTVHVDGLAGSISSVIAMVGDKIIIPSNSYLMIHHALCGVCGNAIEMRKMATTLDSIDIGIVEVYKSKLKDGVDIETIKSFMDEEKWFTGNEASEYFNIEVAEPNLAVAYCGDIKNHTNVPQAILDKINKPIEVIEENTDENINEELELAKAKLRLALL